MNAHRETNLIRELLETARADTERLKDIQITAANLKAVAKAGPKTTKREIDAEVARLEKVSEEMWAQIQSISRRIEEIMGDTDG